MESASILTKEISAQLSQTADDILASLLKAVSLDKEKAVTEKSVLSAARDAGIKESEAHTIKDAVIRLSALKDKLSGIKSFERFPDAEVVKEDKHSYFQRA